MLTQRQIVDERMDAPALDPVAHHAALEGLGRINRISHTARQFLGPIMVMARREKLTRITLLDIASGGGDVPVALARAAAARNLRIDLMLLDRSPTALVHAQAAADRAGLSCRTIEGNALALPDGHFDVITNSLFLHHLAEADQVIHLLRLMRNRAERMILISDLRRSQLGLLAAWTGCRLLSRSAIVHYDGPASVRAAFTLPELCDLAARAGLAAAKIRPCFPFRMLLTWQPEASHAR